MEQRTALSTSRVEPAEYKSQMTAFKEKNQNDLQETASVSQRVQDLEAQNRELQLKCDEWKSKAENGTSAAAGSDSAEVARLQAELEEKSAAVAAILDGKAELQKVCDELFQVMESKE